MLLFPDEILEFFVAGGEDAPGFSEPETVTIRDVVGLRIRADVDGLPDGKHTDRLSELASDKLSICLSNFLSLVRYYFVLNLLRLHAKPTKVDKSFKHPPKFLKFRSAFSRALSVSGELDTSVLSCKTLLILDVLLIVLEIVSFVFVIEYWFRGYV